MLPWIFLGALFTRAGLHDGALTDGGEGDQAPLWPARGIPDCDRETTSSTTHA